MTRNQRQAVRKPATKFANLRKKMQKRKRQNQTAQLKKPTIGLSNFDFRIDGSGIAVGTTVAGSPPHRSVREVFPHTAPAPSRA